MNSSAPQPVPEWSTRQVVYSTLFVALVLVSFALLYRFNRVALILFIAIVLGTAMRPAVDWLSEHGFSRTGGVIFIYLLLFVFVTGLLVLILPIVATQVTAILADVPKYLGDFRNFLFQSPSRIMQRIAQQLPANLSFFAQATPADSGQTLSQVAQFLANAGILVRGVISLAAVILLGFYWTQESDRIILNLLLWVPLASRTRARELISEIEDTLGRFVLGQTWLCLAIGALSLVAYLIIGLPYALVLAIIAGILEAVPVFGPILGAIPALLIALSVDPSKAIWVVVSSVIIQALENYFLVPGVMKRSVGISAFVTLLAMAALTSLLGLVGALMAIPLAAVIQILINRLIISPDTNELETTIGRDQLSLLRYEAHNLAQDVRGQLRQNQNVDGTSEEIVNALEAIAVDLDRILAGTTQAEGES